MRYLLLTIFTMGMLVSCELPSPEAAGLRFETIPSPLPARITWQEIGQAKELINTSKQLVVISGGDNPVPASAWADFHPRFPWTKNIDRILLFQKTAFFRSPYTDADCAGDACLTITEYRGYTWLSLAQPVAVSFIPDGIKTDMLKPDPGTLVVKSIQKCQAIMFTDSIWQLADTLGNYYAMHATETGAPDPSVVLPPGFSLRRVALEDTLVIGPFGGGDACYFNIVGDHLGQGYHQYRFAGSYFPE
ncbi:MAG: hypothetical protein SF053_01230 [Bacteroidia bacterium]|nr:hypothetical protein [Bacteroidia bacterium]